MLGPSEGAPTLEVRVETARGGVGERGRCVPSSDGMAIIELPAQGVSRSAPWESVPGIVAKAVGLGPRPRPLSAGTLFTDRATLARVLGQPSISLGDPRTSGDRDGESRGPKAGPDVPKAWVASLERLSSAVRAHWRVQAVVDEVIVDTLEVLDADSSGLWTLTEVDHRALVDVLDEASSTGSADGGPGVLVLAPTTPTAVWSWLSGLAAIQPPPAADHQNGV